MAINSHSPNLRVGRRADGGSIITDSPINAGTSVPTKSAGLAARIFGLGAARATATPDSVTALLAAIYTNAVAYVASYASDRAHGGDPAKHTTAISRFTFALLTEHGYAESDFDTGTDVTDYADADAFVAAVTAVHDARILADADGDGDADASDADGDANADADADAS